MNYKDYPLIFVTSGGLLLSIKLRFRLEMKTWHPLGNTDENDDDGKSGGVLQLRQQSPRE